MEELDLKELFIVLWEKKVIIAIVTIIFLIIGTVYSYFFITPKYESYTSLLLGKNAEAEAETITQSTTTSGDMITSTDLNLNKNLISTYSELLRSKLVLKDVLTNLKANRSITVPTNLTEDALKSCISVSSVKNTDIIKITVQHTDPRLAQVIASELATAFTDKVNEIYNINNVYVVEEPEIDNTPVNINHIKDMAIFAFIGIALSVMYILVMEMFTIKIKTISDIEKITKIPVLAEFPKMNTGVKGGKIYERWVDSIWATKFSNSRGF